MFGCLIFFGMQNTLPCSYLRCWTLHVGDAYCLNNAMHTAILQATLTYPQAKSGVHSYRALYS